MGKMIGYVTLTVVAIWASGCSQVFRQTHVVDQAGAKGVFEEVIASSVKAGQVELTVLLFSPILVTISYGWQ
jgi:hypothetical protein